MKNLKALIVANQMPVHVQALQAIIRDGMEDSTIADFVLKSLAKNNGKRLTSRHVDELNQAMPGHDFRIRKQFGWTELAWGAYEPKTSEDGGNLMISRATTNVTIDVAWIEKDNARWFSALKERNKNRRKLLDKTEALAQVADAINQYKSAKATLIKLLKDENDGSQSFEPINYDLQEMAGIKSLYE